MRFLISFIAFIFFAIIGQAQGLESSMDGASSTLRHIVFFKLKTTTTAEQYILLEDEIIKLENVEGVRAVEFGSYEDMADKRSIKGHQLIVQLEFENKESFNKYMESERRDQLKEVFRNHLAGMPKTYQYISGRKKQ